VSVNNLSLNEGTELLELAEAAILASAHLADLGRRVERELERDVKVAADRAIHDAVSSSLLSTEIPVQSEEDPEAWTSNEKGLRWILDPLDGSVNLSRGIPLYCISLALWFNDEPVLGVIHDLCRTETFTGQVGVGAKLDGYQISCSSVSGSQNAILCTGFPVGTSFDEPPLTRFVGRVRSFKKVRLLGSAALSLAWVSCGRADAYLEEGIAIWDVAAGLALVQASGGSIRISPYSDSGRLTVLAGSAEICDQLE